MYIVTLILEHVEVPIVLRGITSAEMAHQVAPVLRMMGQGFLDIRGIHVDYQDDSDAVIAGSVDPTCATVTDFAVAATAADNAYRRSAGKPADIPEGATDPRD